MHGGSVSEAGSTAGDACPVCGHTSFEPQFLAPFPHHSATERRAFALDEVVDVPTWRIVRCAGCTARYPNPYPSAAEIDRYYASQTEPSDWEWEHYVEVDQHERDHWAEFAARVTRLRSRPGRLLEIGCAAGWLLVGARDRGWDVRGIEASPKFSMYARERQGLDVHAGTLADCRPGNAGPDEIADATPFDVIVSTDVLEHLVDPVEDLRIMRALLAPDGYLVIATLDIGSLSARRYGNDWRQIVVSHIVYWTRPSIRVALDRAGFEVETISDFRWWDPDSRGHRRARRREVAKFAARQLLVWTYQPLARRSPTVRHLPAKLTRGRVGHETLDRKIGDQPVLGDVMLVVARPKQS